MKMSWLVYQNEISYFWFSFCFVSSVFDNVDIDEVVKVALKWEQGVGLIKGNNIAERDKRWAKGESLSIKSAEKVEDLAKELCDLARENSLDSTKDSPFAMLAKDNDIMWSGGKFSSMFPLYRFPFQNQISH